MLFSLLRFFVVVVVAADAAVTVNHLHGLLMDTRHIFTFVHCVVWAAILSFFFLLFYFLIYFGFFVLFLVDILWAMLNRAHVGVFPFYVCYIIGHIFSVYMCTYRYRYFLCEKEINFVFILSMLNLRAFFVICTRRRPLFPFDIELTRLFSLWAAFFSSCVLILLWNLYRGRACLFYLFWFLFS